MGRRNACFSDVGGPIMVGSDTTENFSNFTPLDWPKKASSPHKRANIICKAKILLISIVLHGDPRII